MIITLDIADKNTGDYGRPFGTYAEIVKEAARAKLREMGWDKPPEGMVTRLYEEHMQGLPTYKEISARIWKAAQERAHPDFTYEELDLIRLRFEMANDEVGKIIAQKAHRMMQK